MSFWIRCQHIDYRSSIAVMYLYVDLFRLAVYSYNLKHDNDDKRIILKDRCINLKAKHFNLQYNCFAGTCTWTLGYCTWSSLSVDPLVNHRVCVYLIGVSTLVVHWYKAMRWWRHSCLLEWVPSDGAHMSLICYCYIIPLILWTINLVWWLSK